MCYSARSSLTTFLIVITVCIYLWIKGGNINKTLSIILLFISLMQILELFIWLNIECSNINKYISLFIPVLLFLQPIIVIVAILYFNSGRLSPTLYKILLGVWLICSPFFINWVNDGFNKCTTVGANGHLIWPYANSPKTIDQIVQTIYNLVLGIGIGTLNTKWYGIFYVVLASLSYNHIKEIYGHSWGSVWCNFVNFLALGALFI
jgi:hypothetical protein